MSASAIAVAPLLLGLRLDASIGAGDEVRTRDIDLGRVALYQLSYSRSESPTRRTRVRERWQLAQTISHFAASAKILVAPARPTMRVTP